jgi:AmmeMemoRadiSam system protein A
MTAIPAGSDSPTAPSEPWQQELLEIARQTLELYITTAMMPVVPPVAGRLAEQAAVFVTLRVRDPQPGAEEELRGCVGQIEPRLPLVEAVQDATIQAATADPRFPPVHESELPGLRIEISILSPMWLVSDLAQIEIGRHGLLIAGMGRRGLLLPSVATQYGWDQREFLRGLSTKAGLPGDAWPERAELYAFTTQHLSE